MHDVVLRVVEDVGGEGEGPHEEVDERVDEEEAGLSSDRDAGVAERVDDGFAVAGVWWRWSC